MRVSQLFKSVRGGLGRVLRFSTSETAFKLLPVAISLAALAFSFWTFYFRDIRVRNGLILVPAETSFPPTVGGIDPEARSEHSFGHRLLLLNDGNRPAAVLSVALRLHTRAPGEQLDLAQLCPSDPDANPPSASDPSIMVGFTDSDGESEVLPAIVEPGKIVSVPLTLSVEFSEDMTRAAKVPVCLRVLALDSAGGRHDRVYPYTIIDTYTKFATPGTVNLGSAGSRDSGKIVPRQLRLIGP
jgi:hypothetical protein